MKYKNVPLPSSLHDPHAYNLEILSTKLPKLAVQSKFPCTLIHRLRHLRSQQKILLIKKFYVAVCGAQ